MRLSPREIEKLMLHNAGFLAQKRYARGLKLNYVEAIALISAQILEFIRDGESSVAELMDKGKQLLGIDDVIPGVASMIHDVQVEGTFPDGTKLVTVHEPVCDERGNPVLALYGSGLFYQSQVSPVENYPPTIPGEIFTADGDIALNVGRNRISLEVLNNGDRPVQVGSHYPFFEVNPALEFDRQKSYAMRLNIAAGTAVRFEPGESKIVELVEIAGDMVIRGGNGLINGSVTENGVEAKLAEAVKRGFQHKGV